MMPPSSTELCPIHDTEVHWVKDLGHWARLFFHSHVQPPAAIQLSGSDVVRAFSHLTLVHSVLFPPTGLDPQQYSKLRLVVPSPHFPGLHHQYQAVNGWWVKGGPVMSVGYLTFESIPKLFLLDPRCRFSLPGRKAAFCSSAV